MLTMPMPCEDLVKLRIRHAAAFGFDHPENPQHVASEPLRMTTRQGSSAAPRGMLPQTRRP